MLQERIFFAKLVGISLTQRSISPHKLLSDRKNGTVQTGSEKTRFWAKLMKFQCRITLFLFTPRKHQRYESISKFDELFEKQHHLSKLLN